MGDRDKAESVADRLKGINIYLIGMMGAGKSTIGKLLQSHLGYGFCDTDTVIEQIAKKQIKDIFKEDGEPEFRNLETKVLEQISAYTRLVVATGGGIVERTQNWSYLQYGLTVWLDAPLEILISRVAENGDRSSAGLSVRPLASQMEARWEKRQPLYAQADLKIDATGTPESIAGVILERIPDILRN